LQSGIIHFSLRFVFLEEEWCMSLKFSIPLVLTAVFVPHTHLFAAANTQTITLDQDLQIPGETLNPGSYTLSVEDRMQDRAIVRISSAHGGLHFLVLGVPNPKLNTKEEKNIILFGSPNPSKRILQGWLCPKCSAPLELVYPKPEAIEITRETGESALAVDPASDKLPANLSPDDMKVVTLWLLSPERVEAGHRGIGLKATKYSAASSRSHLAQTAKQHVLVWVIWNLVALPIVGPAEQTEASTMHVLTFQPRAASGKKPAPSRSAWKRTVLALVTLAGLGWTVSAARSVKANVSTPALPMSYSLAVVAVPTPADSSELERLKTRNRRLEALVEVLRSRSERSQ
jgi:hypothetical protein